MPSGFETRDVDLVPVAAAVPLSAELQETVDEALDVEGAVRRSVPGGLLVSFPLPGGRRQRIQILGAAGAPAGGELLLLATICAPAVADRFEAVLRMNGTLPVGGVAVRSLRGKDYFVLSAGLPAEGLTAARLRSVLRYLAERGDRLEEILTGQDIE
ncbi:MAG: hypothetical protein L0216_04575 [Planctomycetales bacterium]|nr:hypothetical protein [Planctomycetales bacterium]